MSPLEPASCTRSVEGGEGRQGWSESLGAALCTRSVEGGEGRQGWSNYITASGDLSIFTVAGQPQKRQAESQLSQLITQHLTTTVTEAVPCCDSQTLRLRAVSYRCQRPAAP